MNPKLTKGSSGFKSVADGGPIDRYYKPPSIEEYVQMTQRGIKLSNKVQTASTSQKREERAARTPPHPSVQKLNPKKLRQTHPLASLKTSLLD